MRRQKAFCFGLAHDEDDLVRADAYDSLLVFPFADVLDLLEKAIICETDRLARSYAILSWVDVLVLQNDVTKEKLEFAIRVKENDKSVSCSLSWCYALYILGSKSSLKDSLRFLKNDDYRIRCSALSLLGDIIKSDNEAEIKEAVAILLLAESTEAVRSSAEQFLTVS